VKSKVLCLIVISIGITCLIWAASSDKSHADGEAGFLYDFLKGQYLVIGKRPGCNKSYTGRILVTRTGGRLEIIRIIGDTKTRAIGRIESATADKRKVLRIRFSEKNKSYEATYIISSDLDNYPRLTGYVYLEGQPTPEPGIEAWFVDYSVLK